MIQFWDDVYSHDPSFFGDSPSEFAVLCCKEFEKLNVKRILELGSGQGRDALYIASKGIEVYAIDSSKVAVDTLSKLSIEKNLPIHASTFEAKSKLPFEDNFFDSVYSHMFFNMRFTPEEISILFKEVNRILENGGLHFLTVRSDHDTFYKKGALVADKIYDIHGFQIRFFTKEEIKSFAINANFQLTNITEGYENPASLYLVSCSKR